MATSFTTAQCAVIIGLAHPGVVDPNEGFMADTRTELAIEAGTKALHESAREKRQFTWEHSSEEWRRDLRAFVRPIVEAALESSDAFLGAATSKKPTSEDR